MAAAAAVRRPIASKKRKVSADLPLSNNNGGELPKKKSPLFNQPQNYYVPGSSSSMSKDELSEWRKEQRRKRNRESAAASRKKIQGRVGELENEVDEWKKKYSELEHKMRCMEKHIELLTKMNGSSSSGSSRDQASSPTTVSHPNSPPRSPMGSSAPVPHEVASSSVLPPPAYSSHTTNVPNAFPPLLSELPKDTTKVETQNVGTNSAVPVVVAKVTITSNDESKKHIKSISRQA